VIYNPAAGRGRAEALLRELTATLGADAELRPSREPGHMVELGRAACMDGFARVVAAGGDGTVHEVANGVLQSGNRDVVFAVWPLGSANDFAYSLGMTQWWKRRGEHLPTEPLAIDVGRVTAPGREVFMVGNVGVGFNGMVTVEARKTRWLRGMPLYGWAFLKAMVKHFATPTMTISFDDCEVTTPTLALSILNAQREGNFPIRPAARLDDGLFDFMHATRLSRGHLLRFLPGMATGKLPENHKLLRLGRARRVAVRSVAPLCVHADGEFVCIPENGIHAITVELLPRRLKVEVFPQALYGEEK
jgi:diacylglycerol kinase family enzyme